MLDARQRRALIVEAHHYIRRTKEGLIESLSGDRESLDGFYMSDRAPTDEDVHAIKQLTLAQVSALDKLVEGALASVVFQFLTLLDGADGPDGMDEWHGVELAPAPAKQEYFLHDDFYPVYGEMRRYEGGDHSFDVRDGEPPKHKLS